MTISINLVGPCPTFAAELQVVQLELELNVFP